MSGVEGAVEKGPLSSDALDALVGVVQAAECPKCQHSPEHHDSRDALCWGSRECECDQGFLGSLIASGVVTYPPGSRGDA